MIRTVKLYGHLGKKFGKVHTYDVRSTAEVIRALIANHTGFEKELLDKNIQGYKILVGDTVYTKDMILYPVDDTIKIVPIVQGAGGDNIGMIVIGVVLIAAAVILQQYEFVPVIAGETLAGGAVVAEGVTVVSAAAYSTAAAYAAAGMMAVGSALLLSGVSGLLFSPTSPTSRDAEEQITSTYFNGAVNLTSQGNPVPLIYGKARIGSQVVSAAMLTYKV